MKPIDPIFDFLTVTRTRQRKKPLSKAIAFACSTPGGL